MNEEIEQKLRAKGWTDQDFAAVTSAIEIMKAAGARPSQSEFTEGLRVFQQACVKSSLENPELERLLILRAQINANVHGLKLWLAWIEFVDAIKKAFFGRWLK